MNFDDVLNHIGGFGKFQKILYVWICLPQILLGFHMLVSIFTGAIPPHRCRAPSVGLSSSPGTSEILNFSLTASSEGSDLSCSAYSPQSAPNNHNHSWPPTDNSTATSCTEGWEYSKETFQSTIVTEWDLVCDNAKLNNIGSSIYMFGLLVGAVVYGALADKYGRRCIILLGLAVQTVFGVGAAFSPNYYVYVFLRFVIGTTISAVIMNAFVLGTEWTGTKDRMLAGVITDYFFGIGYILLAGVAYLFRDWRKLQLAISAPGFLLIFYIWVLPKSARWLLANQRKDEAILLIRKAAADNGTTVPVDIELLQESNGPINSKEEKKRYTVIDLFRTPKMRIQSLILFYLWFVNILVYYGLSLNISDFGINIYLTQFIFGLVEMPARTITLFTLNRSRKISQFSFLTVGGMACLLTIAVPEGQTTIRTALAMAGKFGITASLSIVYIYSAEIFPTVIRQNGIGMSSMCARVGGVIAPLIYLLRAHNKEAPMVIFGVCPLVGAALSLILPETAHTPLPDTIKDVEEGSNREKSTGKSAHSEKHSCTRI
ncbi:organic cation transporter protein [Lepisosteus oculatus]|uniref:organic cation transporter protein n=1 Tax=Lepisosteus oculatus TaxID=7918 RepID=UPI0007404038|nr:PREDICTED: organic cation transporter protein-like isoform X1 [Lepisosteus oculatus]